MKRFLGLLVVAIVVMGSAPAAFAASKDSFDGAYAAVQSAFLQVQGAESKGGNVTSLVGQLNAALALMQKAAAENASNPAQAAADLQAAVQAARSVQSDAGPAGEAGAAAKESQFVASLTSAAAIVVIAALVYLYGDRVYRRAWLRAYRDYVVKRVG